MSWEDYKNWLEENILETQEESEESNDENKTDLYTLHPEAKTKYSISNEKTIIAAFANLITSIENSKSYSFSSYSDSSNEYHILPSLTQLVDEENRTQTITWNQLFPSRTEALFGPKTNTTPLDQSTFNILGKIFNDWVQTVTRAKRLKGMLDDKQVMGKFVIEMAISLNYELIKRKGYDSQLKNWLKEYEQLEDDEAKKGLAEQKIMVEQILKAFAEESASRSRQSESNQQLNFSWDWKEIGKWGLIVGIVVFAFVFLRKILKD